MLFIHIVCALHRACVHCVLPFRYLVLCYWTETEPELNTASNKGQVKHSPIISEPMILDYFKFLLYITRDLNVFFGYR
jgi:hypothetical protein